MRKKISVYFLAIFFFLVQNKNSIAQIDNAIIISVGDQAITRLDLLNEIKLIAILSNTDINNENREQIKGLAVKSLIKRNIKKNEIEKRNVNKYNATQLNAMIDNTSNKLGINRSGLKQILKSHNLSFEKLVKRFEVDLKWNYMIFQMYKNKISLNTAEIEDKLRLELEKIEGSDGNKNLENIKEKIITIEKEKKLKMFSNMHYSNIERSVQIKFL